MPTETDNNSISGVETTPEPRPSLREIAEAAYDEGSTPETAPEERLPSEDTRARDERGRFAAKEQPQEPGEAERRAPSPETTPKEAQDRPDTAPQGTSNQIPEHWSAEFRADFAKLPQEGQNILLRRYGEMEADYTRKSQANATAVQAVNALAPIFQDPDIARSLQENQMHPIQAIQDWARMHKAASNPDPRVRAHTLYEIAERMGFDPAKVFAPNRPPTSNLPEHLQKDPAVQFFADQASKTESDLQALRSELNQFRSQETQRIEGEALRATRWSIDNFADEKDQSGKPLRPYFDRVLSAVIDMYRANPDRDLQEAYETACWMDPAVRQEMMRMEWTRTQHAASNQRAAQAVRSNVRGMTNPVSKPAPDKKGNGSLRDALEASADEVGFS
jgi:hypothetical protein